MMSITGKVISEDFEPMIGAGIHTKDSLYFTQANQQGEFEILIPNQNDSLKIWMVGMETETVSIKDKCHINIVLGNANNLEFDIPEETMRNYLNKVERTKKKVRKKATSIGIFTDNDCYDRPNLLSGRLVNSNNEPIVGCNVLVKDSIRGVVTDECGNFQFDNLTSKSTIVFSCIEFCLYVFEFQLEMLDSTTSPTYGIKMVDTEFDSDCGIIAKKRDVIWLDNLN